MTTIVAFQTNHGKPHIIMASDQQITFYANDKPTIKRQKHKIRYQKTWMIAGAGNYSNELYTLYSYFDGNRDYESLCGSILPKGIDITDVLDPRVQIKRDVYEHVQTLENTKGTSLEEELKKLEQKKNPTPLERDLLARFLGLKQGYRHPIDRAIAWKYFPEIALLNSVREYKEGEDLEELPSFLLASNKPDLGLYHVLSSGLVEEVQKQDGIVWKALGSGAEIAEEYMEQEEYTDDKQLLCEVDTQDFTARKAIALAIRLVEKALKDAQSGGPVDIVVIDEQGTHPHGKQIQKGVMEAIHREEEKILEKYPDEQ